MEIKVSIIIPVYNRSELIRETLDSVLEQTYSNWQCIAVDDGSTDNSMDILAEYANKDNRFTFFQRPESRSKGANACRNIGLQNAVGDYVMFLDSDDLLSPTCLEERVAFASSFSEADMCVFKMNFFKERPGDTDLLVNKTELREVETYLKKYLKYDIPWPITAMFIKRASLKIEFDDDDDDDDDE